MRKIFLLLLPFSVLVFAVPVHAHCPLCTGAVAIAAVSASYYGIDTAVIGLFIGAFAISTGLWVGRKIKKQYIKFQLPLIVLSSFLLTVVPLLSIGSGNVFFNLFLFGEDGSLFNNTYLIDKMLFGGVIGGMVSVAGFKLHTYVKNIRNGVLFPFQGVVFTLLMLMAAAGSLYAMTGV